MPWVWTTPPACAGCARSVPVTGLQLQLPATLGPLLPGAGHASPPLLVLALIKVLSSLGLHPMALAAASVPGLT